MRAKCNPTQLAEPKVQASSGLEQSRAAVPVDDGVHKDLDGVLVRQQVHDVKGVLHNADLCTGTAVRQAPMVASNITRALSWS